MERSAEVIDFLVGCELGSENWPEEYSHELIADWLGGPPALRQGWCPRSDAEWERFLHFTGEAEKGNLILYRGFSGDSDEAWRSIHWTTDRQQAEWFAKRFLGIRGRPRAWVSSVSVPPSAILAVVCGESEHDRNESEKEVLVDFRLLSDVQTTEVFR